MSFSSYRANPREFCLAAAWRFYRAHFVVVVLLSVLVVVPCFWHRHIQAGDLGSHIYNAWLAQLVEHHQVSGLVVVRQWDNVLFDLLVLHAADLFGFTAAERIAVSFTVLVFFWGSFSFLAVGSKRAPWLLTPFLFVLSYGYAFHMGFVNYYLSLGLAFFALAACWRNGAGNWLVAGAIAAIGLVAHPIGFVLFVALAGYVAVWRVLPRWPRLMLPVLAVVCFVLLRHHFAAHEELDASWRPESFLSLLGQDQINIYGHRYEVLSWFALGWAVICAVGAVYDWVFRERKPGVALRLAAELYVVAVIATICLPENFRTSMYAGWVGLLVSRLTLVTAVFGLLVMACAQMPEWTRRGGVLIAAVFFAYLYQDTGKLDRMEANARAWAAKLPVGTRIVAVANAPGDWRVGFIYHSIDRSCIGRCFSFANYEASSLQFRVRALRGSYVVTNSVDQSDDMSSGDYIMREKDLPLTSIYQCDDADWTSLCALPLRVGQKTEDPEMEPVAVPHDDDSEE